MTLDLSYSYCACLTKSEEIEIDTSVSRNRRKVYIFVRNLSSNAKYKSKRLIIGTVLGAKLWFTNIQPSEAMGLSIKPELMGRVQRRYEDTFKLGTPEMVVRRNSRIAYSSNREILYLICATDQRLTSNEEVLKILKKFRAGSLYMDMGIALAVVMIVVASIAMISEGFAPSYVSTKRWGLHHDHQTNFQPPSVEKQIREASNFRPRKEPGSTLGATKPIDLTQQQFDALSPQGKREVEHANDMKIIYKGER
jgi:hypothetical protein